MPACVIFDLEANADQALPLKHEIIDIGAVLVRGGDEVNRFGTFVRPTRRLVFFYQNRQS